MLEKSPRVGEFQTIGATVNCQDASSNPDPNPARSAPSYLVTSDCPWCCHTFTWLLECTNPTSMPETTAPVRACIEVVFSNRHPQTVPIADLPFFIGRGKESGNHLPLDDMRISRKCVAISTGPSGFVIEDRGQLNGVFVNGEPTRSKSLSDGDRIRLGTDDGCQLVFRLQAEETSQETAETKFRSLLGSWGTNSADELKGLRMLLEATQLLHSQLPLESVLAAMLDHAVAITNADRGMLLEPDAAGVLQVRVARARGGETLPTERMNPSRSVLGRAIELESAVVNEDLNLADLNVQTAQSVMLQLLRSAVVVPLYATVHESADGSHRAPRRLLGPSILIPSGRQPSRRWTGKSSTLWGPRPPAFLTMRGSWSANANAGAWNRS